ncbi:hypothetical protein BDV36DRAFT_269431 [Aspergillus pseudocaelatus]|uniref:Secreted protein n=1 Tax=Aspergillus pseudocaelatus TaxID=1825620 RepID=A0ABQ6W7T7_9EURO|nr:hypothetical protein BDV36DRAFT_269431 [Aspergillus pseudocaelatus]
MFRVRQIMLVLVLVPSRVMIFISFFLSFCSQMTISQSSHIDIDRIESIIQDHDSRDSYVICIHNSSRLMDLYSTSTTYCQPKYSVMER